MGLNFNSILGTGQTIMVMDGGRVFEKHREFGADANGTVVIPKIIDGENLGTSYSSHATSVAGIIGAIVGEVLTHLMEPTQQKES